MKQTLSLFAFLALIASPAMAQTTAKEITSLPVTKSGSVSKSMQLHAGPGIQYPLITTIPAKQNLQIHSCTSNYGWCDVEAENHHGWVPANDLYLKADSLPVSYYREKSNILPTVNFNQATYWDRYYRDQDFYRKWYIKHPNPPVSFGRYPTTKDNGPVAGASATDKMSDPLPPSPSSHVNLPNVRDR